jgi:hypothetical protein
MQSTECTLLCVRASASMRAACMPCRSHVVVLSSTCMRTGFDLLIGSGTLGAASRVALTTGRGLSPANMSVTCTTGKDERM